jgi:hypothetical protein
MSEQVWSFQRAAKLAHANKGALTPEEYKRRVDAYLAGRAAGKPMNAVALELGINQRRWYEFCWTQFPEHYAHIGQRNLRQGSPQTVLQQQSTRRCLGPDCGEMFLSRGPGHRICASCKQRNAESYSPYTPDPGGSRGKHVQAKRA